MTRGFSSIGLVRPKDHANVGAVLRAAYCYGVSMVAIQGDRTPVRSHVDTPKAWKHIPVLRSDDLHVLVPFDAVPVAVDLVDDAMSLPDFQHPPPRLLRVRPGGRDARENSFGLVSASRDGPYPDLHELGRGSQCRPL